MLFLYPPFQPVSVGEGIIPYHSYNVVLLSIIESVKHFHTSNAHSGFKGKDLCTYTYYKIFVASILQYTAWIIFLKYAIPIENVTITIIIGY